MDILIIILISAFGLLCSFNLKKYIADVQSKKTQSFSSDTLIDEYLDILDSIQDLDEATLLKNDLVIKMRRNKAERLATQTSSFDGVVNFSDYRTKKRYKI